MPTKDMNKSQQGFASIIIALTFIVVLTIMTVGFVAITNREQQQSLDKYLATQANYEAESGINDVVNQLNNNPAAVTDQTTCQDSSINTYLDYSTNTIGGAYTCVLISHLLPDITYQNIAAGEGRSAVFDLNGSPLSSLKISWTTPSATTLSSTSSVPANSLLGVSNWTYPSLLQVDFVPLGISGSTDRTTLLSKVFHTFFYPTSLGSGTIGYNPSLGSQGQLIAAHCNNQDCDGTISFGSLSGQYLIHIVNYYATSSVLKITANGGGAQIHGAQVQIDVTGKAHNVLKRLQVRTNNGNSFPDFGIEGQSICSRLLTDPSDTQYFDLTGAATTDPNDPCNPEG